MDFKDKLRKNINKQYIFTVMGNMDLTRGIWMLYLASKGLTLFEIGLMETIYHISSFTMEIPTGAVADILGRKTSRIIGKFVTVIALLIMILGGNKFAFAISFFFTALGNNLESGAGEALVYDSLKEIKEEEKYIKINGKNEFFSQIVGIISLVLGGYVATMSFLNVYKIALIIALLAVFQAFTFTEPTIGVIQKSHSFIKTFTKQIKDSIEVIRKDKRILFTILTFELFETLFMILFYYNQNRLSNLGNTTLQIGIVLALGNLLAAIIATQTHKIEKELSLEGTLKIAALIAAICFWLISIINMGKIAFIVLCGIEVILFITIGDYINRLIPSKQRATILSMQSMVFSFFMIILFPIMGKIGDIYGLEFSFKIVAIIASILLTIVFIFLKKK